MNITIESVQIDEASKSLLKKLVAAGYAQAGVEYVIDPKVASADDFQPVLKAIFQSKLLPLFESYTVPKTGRDAGKVFVKLSFDLA